MFIQLLKKIFDKNERYLSSTHSLIKNINEIQSKYSVFTHQEIIDEAKKIKNIAKKNGNLKEILPNAFALVKESIFRNYKIKIFNVQLQGGCVLNDGMIAEMKTGEGKTFVAAFPLYLNSLLGKGVHLVTANDYLAESQCNIMKPVYNYLGASCECIISTSSQKKRKEAYLSDITYVTNNELAFDYLRDNMAISKDSILQRQLFYAVIDEVDSILIDEARTPLIISSQDDENKNIFVFKKINKVVNELTKKHYKVDYKSKCVFLTEDGKDIVEEKLKNQNIIYDKLYKKEYSDFLHYMNQSLKANFLFECNKEYVVRNNKIVIVDEFTGRFSEGRRYSDGLHQAIEIKHKVEVLPESKTVASTSFQNYFRLYKKISGMTGTAYTEREEFKSIYNLDIIQIPTNKNVIRKDYNDNVYSSESEKNIEILKLVKKCREKQQPVLIGTSSVEKSEILSKLFNRNNIFHSVLNAKQNAQEAQIIAEAGAPSKVTISTSMAGRGTDIKLGGDIDRKISLLDKNDSQYESRKKTLIDEYNEKKEIVKKAGGLFIIGGERSDSRRLDNQLIGRSGRQGDPGASKFFISIEDNIIEYAGYGKENNTWAANYFREQILGDKNSDVIEEIQRIIEFRHYDSRKSVLQFDDVINKQRNTIYQERRSILFSKNIMIYIKKVLSEYILSIKEKYFSYKNEELEIEKIQNEVNKIIGKNYDIKGFYENNNSEKLFEHIHVIFNENLNKKIVNIDEESLKILCILILDKVWQKHLTYLTNLQGSVGILSYGQKKPINEFKQEAYNSFLYILDEIFSLTLQSIFSFNSEKYKKLKEKYQNEPLSNSDVISKNSMCPCNSGKKYKYCCQKK